MMDFLIKKLVEYNFRTKQLCDLPPTSSQRFGTKSLKFKGNLLWNNFNDEIKTAHSLAVFKQKSEPGMVLNAHATFVKMLSK